MPEPRPLAAVCGAPRASEWPRAGTHMLELSSRDSGAGVAPAHGQLSGSSSQRQPSWLEEKARPGDRSRRQTLHVRGRARPQMPGDRLAGGTPRRRRLAERQPAEPDDQVQDAQPAARLDVVGGRHARQAAEPIRRRPAHLAAHTRALRHPPSPSRSPQPTSPLTTNPQIKSFFRSSRRPTASKPGASCS